MDWFQRHADADRIFAVRDVRGPVPTDTASSYAHAARVGVPNEDAVLSRFVADARTCLLHQPPTDVAERHMRAMLATFDALPAEPAPAAAREHRVQQTVARVRREERGAVRTRQVPRVALAGGVAFAMLGGMASAGQLPPQLQRPVSELAHTVGVSVPHPAHATHTASTRTHAVGGAAHLETARATSPVSGSLQRSVTRVQHDVFVGAVLAAATTSAGESAATAAGAAAIAAANGVDTRQGVGEGETGGGSSGRGGSGNNGGSRGSGGSGRGGGSGDATTSGGGSDVSGRGGSNGSGTGGETGGASGRHTGVDAGGGSGGSGRGGSTSASGQAATTGTSNSGRRHRGRGRHGGTVTVTGGTSGGGDQSGRGRGRGGDGGGTSGDSSGTSGGN